MQAKRVSALALCLLTGISVFVEATNNVVVYGNNIVGRQRHLHNQGKRAFIDTRHYLPDGKVIAFHLFVQAGVGNDTSPLRLQIWSPVKLPSFRYTLKWEKTVTLNQGDGRQYKFTNLSVPVNKMDVIGWTAESGVSPISFEYKPFGRTYYYKIEDDFPTVGQEYTFDKSRFPAIFSIAVLVDICDRLKPGESFYGNNVIPRNNWSQSQGKKSWMDPDSVLPSGRISTFSLYIHKNATAAGVDIIRLQVWAPHNEALNEYRLKWEKRERLDQGVGRKYDFPVNNVEVKSGDRIGWTVESDIGPISFDYVQNHYTYYRNIEGNEYPKVNRTYHFGSTHFPSIFSVGVIVNTKSRPIAQTTTQGNSFDVNLINGCPPLGNLSVLLSVWTSLLCTILSLQH